MCTQFYFDYAATTPVKKEVLEEMLPFFSINFGNPSSIYNIGRQSRDALDVARDRVSKTLNSKSEEIFFTGGGSESDNWAIKGVAFANKDKGNHIITSKIEHHAVLNTCEYLEKKGFEITYLDVDKYGLVSVDDLKGAIRDDTILVSIMYANNEIGTMQPIKELAQIAREKEIIFHTDAVQAYGNEIIDVKDLGVDLLSISAHKIYGPKGVGALYIKKGTKIHQLIHGGAQEKKRRAGTENMPGIVGLGKAAEMAYENIEEHIDRLVRLRDRLINGIMTKIPYTKLNGHPTKRLPGNANISFEFIEGESLLLSLDIEGIAASTGSACTSGSLSSSHVLMAIGLTHEMAHGSLRLTIGDFTTEDEIDYVIEKLQPIVDRLRRISPLYEKVRGK
ncbi:MAG: cysteine desulfurase NifS [Candidatus Alkaliphilus sp. MAG34]